MRWVIIGPGRNALTILCTPDEIEGGTTATADYFAVKKNRYGPFSNSKSKMVFATTNSARR